MRVLNLKFWLLFFCLLGAGNSLGQQLPEAIDLQAASSTYDRANGHLVFKDITIRQGELKISAQLAEATNLEFENAAWVFSGAVVISLEGTVISAEKAVVDFREHNLVRASITGHPATIRRESSEKDAAILGQADEMVYDRVAGTLRLRDNAIISAGNSEISGSSLLYDFSTEQVVAGSPDDDAPGVRIIITPPEKTDEESASSPNEPATNQNAEDDS